MNRLLAIAGPLALAVMLALMVLPVSHIPLLDANRQVLAESAAEGFCAGEVYVTSQGQGDPEAMGECIAESDRPAEKDWTVVQDYFCSGLRNRGMPIEQAECKNIMVARQLWPTMQGTLTASWNRRFPFPGDILRPDVPVQSGDESRTGDREGNTRGGFTRGD